MAQIGVKLGIDGEAEYRRNLQNIIQSTKTLDKQLGELESSFDDETKSMEQNAAETELLQKKAELLNREVEEMQKMVDAAAEMYGESSTQCQKWEASLATAQTELNKTNAEIEQHNQYAEEASSALGQLTTEIESQTAELDELRTQYVNAVLEFGSTSDEAEELASQISNLSGELQANQAALDEANVAADNLTSGLEGVSGAENDTTDSLANMVGQWVPGFDMMKSAAMGAGLAEMLGGIVGVIGELGGMIIEAADDYTEALHNMEVATGLTGDELDSLMEKTGELWKSFEDADTSIGDVEGAMSMLTTRLGLTEDETAVLGDAFMQYATITGTDVKGAVNDVIDIMKQYGLATGDAAADTETAIGIMDALTQAQSDADVSVEQLAGELSKQAGAFQALGLSYEDAIGYMTAYRDAGGNVSDISTAMFNVVKNLGGKTDDLGAAWKQAMFIMSNSTDTFSTLDHEIGNTGVTIEQAFGAKKAQTMINTFSNGSVNAQKFTNSIKSSSGVVSQYFNDTRTVWDKLSLGVKNYADQGIQGTMDFGGAIRNLQNVSDIFSTVFSNDAKQIENSSQGVSSAASNMNSNVNSDFNAMKNSSDSMASYISGKLYGLQHQFNTTTLKVNLSAPEIGYLQGGTSQHPTYTPYSGGRYTFARAYNDAIRLTSPTIFGMQNGNMLVGGDRQGAEIVVGERHLLDMFTSAVKGAGGQTINVVVNGAEGQNVNDLANLVIDKLQMELIESEAGYA